MNENNDLDIKLDPIENTEDFKKIEKELNEKIELFLNTQHISKGTLGYCHAYWETKKNAFTKILQYWLENTRRA